jgi:curved DNA-binding protein CbpA
MDKEKDYYYILGVLPTAEDVVIQAAYRALAQRYHPDKQQEEEKEEDHLRMVEINEAYEILSDAERRATYDDLRSKNLDAQASYISENNVESETRPDPLAEDWATANQYYPDLFQLEQELGSYSWRLAYTFRVMMLETKEYDHRKEVMEEMRDKFLQLYFGNNPSINRCARLLIKHGLRDQARKLNRAVRVIGTKSDPNRIVEVLLSDQTQLYVNYLIEELVQIRMGEGEPSLIIQAQIKKLFDLVNAKAKLKEGLWTRNYWEVNYKGKLYEFTTSELIAWIRKEFH